MSRIPTGAAMEAITVGVASGRQPTKKAGNNEREREKRIENKDWQNIYGMRLCVGRVQSGKRIVLSRVESLNKCVSAFRPFVYCSRYINTACTVDALRDCIYVF